MMNGSLVITGEVLVTMYETVRFWQYVSASLGKEWGLVVVLGSEVVSLRDRNPGDPGAIFCFSQTSPYNYKAFSRAMHSKPVL